MEKNNEGKVLGKRVEYPKGYCPEVLVAVPRSQNREVYGIYEPEGLFCGYDIWHAYEASFIRNNGMPVVGILKIVYSATSRYIVESKSLKLYFGSFNMMALGDDLAESISRFTDLVTSDLNELLDTKVEVCFYQAQPANRPFDFNEYTVLEETSGLRDVSFSNYQEHPAYLSEHLSEIRGELKVGSHLLKSNCKITNQPDWGSIYIHLLANSRPSETDLLKYIVSLRNENHFHEEVCEMVYKRLWDLFSPEVLAVSCLYTRRGGIDICPIRANCPEYLPEFLPQAGVLTERGFRQ